MVTKVFIVILNWNGKKDTLECLKSLHKLQATSCKLQIVVVDNGSTDGSVEEIQKLTLRLRSGQEFKIIQNKKNLGFAAGNNIGIKHALGNGADYIITLNNDTVAPQNFLELVENEADVVGPVIKFKSNGRWIYDYGGYLNRWIGRPRHYELPYHTKQLLSHTGDGSCRSSAPRVSHSLTSGGPRVGRPDSRHPSPVLPIDYLSGCCLAVKREVFEKIGLFDERFFLYFEDVDFCLRTQKAGFKIALEPKVVIFHKLGGTIGRWSRNAIFHNLKSNFIFIRKHLGWRWPIGSLYLLALSIKIILNRLIGK